MKVRVPILVLAVVLGFSGARANLLQNGSFETYAKAPSTWSTPNIVDFYLNIGNTDIAGWTIINGDIDYMKYSTYTWQAAEGERCLDLCGNPGSGGVSQTFPTEIGSTYEVQFHMSANPMTGYSGGDQLNKTYAATQVAYMTDESHNLTSKVVVSGTIVQKSDDSLEATWAAAVYAGSFLTIPVSTP